MVTPLFYEVCDAQSLASQRVAARCQLLIFRIDHHRHHILLASCERSRVSCILMSRGILLHIDCRFVQLRLISHLCAYYVYVILY